MIYDSSMKKKKVKEVLEGVQPALAYRTWCAHVLHKLYADHQEVSALPVQDQIAEDLARELREKQEALCKSISLYWDRVFDAEALICAIEEPVQRLILRMRYVDGMAWPDIISELPSYGLNIGERQVFRIYSAALKSAQKVMFKE